MIPSQLSETAYAAVIALDWADRQHAWALSTSPSSHFQTGWLDNTPEAVHHWASQLAQAYPGGSIAGDALAPRLIAALGTDGSRFPTAQALQNYTGISPVVERSGRQCWTHYRHACPRFVCQTIHEWALHSIPYCQWARDYYQQQRARGKSTHLAVRALAFKWLRILFRCWQNHTPYSDAHYQQALAKRHPAPCANPVCKSSGLLSLDSLNSQPIILDKHPQMSDTTGW